MSFAAVRKALGELEALGMISKRQGSGTYVTYRPTAAPAVERLDAPVVLMLRRKAHIYGGLRAELVLHLFDLFLAQSAGVLHRDLVFFLRTQVLGADGEDAIDIHVKRHLD